MLNPVSGVPGQLKINKHKFTLHKGAGFVLPHLRYLSGRGNHALLDSVCSSPSAYYFSREGIARPAKQALAKGQGYTQCRKQEQWRILVHAEIPRCIPTRTLVRQRQTTRTSRQIAQQPIALQARPTCSRRATVVSSDCRKLFCILPSI